MADQEGDARAGAAETNGYEAAEGLANNIKEARDAAQGDNKFQQAIAAWRALDHTKLMGNLDTVASELVVQQKDSLIQRKDLAQKTKDFRKLDEASKLVQVKDLLKAYQSYIDVLTNHNKTINSAFMQAYSPLSEAPDPYPLLDASVDALITADEVMPKLQSDNEHLQKQVSKITGQLEESERQLEAERTKRQSFEGSQGTKIEEVETSWTAVLKEKEDNWAAKERSFEEKIENQDRLLKELKASYEVSQRLDKAGGDGENAGQNNAVAAELEFASTELEKTTVRLAEIEARNEQLRVELAHTASQTHSSSRSMVVEEDPAYLRLRSENSSLLRRLDSARYEKDSQKSGLETKLRTVDREIQMLQADRDAMQSRLHKWSDYEEIRRELEMLRAIEFANVEDAEIGDDEDLSVVDNVRNKSRTESLERLLLARNKKLSNELTGLRVSHQELNERLELLQEDLSSTNMDLEKTRNLNAMLENDLQKTQQEASNAFETMSVAGTMTSRYPKSTYGSRRGGGTSPTSSIIGGYDPQAAGGSPRTLEALRAGEAVGGGSGILPMVTAQRDRFKKKIAELEKELQKQYQVVSGLRSEIASLQKDNLNLYEKTRYVSTYNRNGTPATSGASYGANPNPSHIAVGDVPSPLSLDRYRSAYESNISPFAAFRGRESARAFKRMSLPERAIFQITRMVLATRTSRNLFAVYCLGLHLLIMAMLYWMGSATVETQASNLGAAAIVGAADLAAGDASHGDWQQQGFEGRVH